jgi:hypothetical protein
MSATPESVLVLGATASGKSSYVGQLVLRTEHAPDGRLRAAQGLSSYGALDPVLKHLQIGLAPGHTEHGTYAESTLTLEDRETGGQVQIVWPEFAGEQVEVLARDRIVSPEWAGRVRTSDIWILFIRASHMFLPEDALSRRIAPIATGSAAAPAGEEGTILSGQARLIELLQLLTFIRGLGGARPVHTPVLGIVLSCYDELADASTSPPAEVLHDRLPFVSDFVCSMWAPESLLVFGVAALGRSLDPVEPDLDFLAEGPEANGYLVLPDGSSTPDLTLALSMLLDRGHGR